MIDTDTIQQEIEQEEELNKIDDMIGETNPYQELILNNAEKVEPLMICMAVLAYLHCLTLVCLGV